MWHVKIHHLVLKEDFKSIDPHQQRHILKIIHKKLSVDPENYGDPLRGGFTGLWRLRIEDYRVVYQILKEQIIVYVVKVGIRRDNKVYEELLARLKKLSPQ